MLAVFWFAGRRGSSPGAEGDIREVVALNRAQIALVQREAAAAVALEEGEEAPVCETPALGLPMQLPLPIDGRERLAFLSHLGALCRGDASARLQAMAAARRWGHPAALPLLRRGLRDPDPAVMGEAALAIEQFRGRPFPSAPPLPGSAAQSVPLPRNVARIR